MKRLVHGMSMLLVFIVSSNSFGGYNAASTDDYYTEALWNMNSATNNVVVDENTANTWRHRELKLYNGATISASSKFGAGALSLDGVDDYAQTVYPWVKHRSGVKIEVWVWIDSTSTGDNYIVQSGSYRLWANGSTVYFRVFDARDNYRTLPVSISRNTWQYLTADFNEGAMSLRVNQDAAVTDTTPKNKVFYDTGNVIIGNGFKGRIDDLKISSPKVTSRSERGKDVVECAFLDYSMASSDPLVAALSCASTLWLGVGGNVTQTDIDSANIVLDQLDDPAIFPGQIPAVQPADDSRDLSMYWALPTLVRILNDPNIYNRMTTGARQSVENILKNFVKNRDLASDATTSDAKIWTVYKSMNHDWLRKSTFLLADQYFKNHGIDPAYGDGFSAYRHYAEWAIHLKEKLNQMAERGIDPEIASPGYVSITLEALFNIRDFSQDADLKAEAEKFINLLLADFAAESFHGVRGGSKTRCYKAVPGSEWANDADWEWFSFWTHLLVNDPVTIVFHDTYNIDRTFLGSAMSDYTVPTVVNNLMTNTTNKSFIHTSRRPAAGYHDVANNNPIYHFEFPSDIYRYTYADSKFIMGSFTVMDVPAYSYYTMLNEIDQWMGLVTLGWRYSRAYFQTETYGSHADLTAVQSSANSEPMTAMLIKRQEHPDPVGALYCWLSEDFNNTRVGPDASTNYWIFAKNYTDDVYIAFKAIDATSANFYQITPQSIDNWGTSVKITFADSNTVVAFEACDASLYGNNFANFQSDINDNYYRDNGGIVDYVTCFNNRELFMYKDGTLPKVDGVTVNLNITPNYQGSYLYNDSEYGSTIHLKDPLNNTLNLDFTYPTPSSMTTTPTPADGATGVSISQQLSWNVAGSASYYDVFFGTSATAISNAVPTNPPSGLHKAHQTGTSYNPGTLSNNTTYYWRIDTVNATGSVTVGSVWSFTTVKAAPTFVAAGAVTHNTAGITPSLPAGIATNDILLMFLETANQAISITNQNGGTWTQITNSPQGTGTAGGTSAARLTAFWSRYNGTQGAPTTSDSGDHQAGVIIAIRGATVSGNPWNVTAGGVESASDTSGSIPGATSTVANTLVVTAIASSLPDYIYDNNRFSSWTNANLTSLTERLDCSRDSGNGGGLGVATGVKATAGAYGNTAVTLATAAAKGMMSIAIKP